MTSGREPSGLPVDVDRVEALQRLVLALHQAESPQGFYEEAVAAVVGLIGADRAALLLYDAGGVMRFVAWRGLSPGYRAVAEGHSPWRRDEANPRPVLVPEVSVDADLAPLRAAIAAEGIAAVAFVPLAHHGRLLGKFMLYYDAPHAFDGTEVAIAEIVAAHVVVALERWRADERLRRAAEASQARLATLAEVTAALSVAASMDEVADAVLATAAGQLGARSGSLCLLQGAELVLAYALGYPEEVLAHWRRFPFDADLPASEVVRQGKAVFVRDLVERDRRYPIFASTPVIEDQAMAVIPLVVSPLGSGRPIGCLVLGFPEARDFSSEDEDFLYLLANRCAGALERARLTDEREVARQAAEAAGEELSFLAAASAALGETLRSEETVARVCQLAVSRLADGCAIYLATDGEPRLEALHHRHPERAAAIRALGERYPPRRSDPGGVGAVIRLGCPQHAAPLTDDDLRALAVDADHLGMLREAGTGSEIIVPLVARRRTIGAMSLVAGGGRILGDDVASLAEELARRAAVAIDNALLFEERNEVARALQQSLLPPLLPSIDGVDLAARYLPAAYDIGGDFYDIFLLPTGSWLVALGDVCGKGPAAAAVTGLIRSAVRTVAVTETDPCRILSMVNEVMLSQVDEQRLFTMVLGIFDPSGAGALDLRLCCAGHPAPLVVRAGGRVEAAATGGMLLGVFADPSLDSQSIHLGAGDAIVFFTDGVSDASRGHDPDVLPQCLARHAGTDASGLADQVLGAAHEEPKKDDIAVLVLRVAPEPSFL